MLLYEDIHTDIQKTCRGIYDFLGVDPEFIVDDRHKHNAISGEPRLKWVVAGLFSKNKFKRKLSALIPERLRMKIVFFIFKILLKRETLDVDTRKQISEYFREDIVKLEKLIGRDLSGWQN